MDSSQSIRKEYIYRERERDEGGVHIERETARDRSSLWGGYG